MSDDPKVLYEGEATYVGTGMFVSDVEAARACVAAYDAAQRATNELLKSEGFEIPDNYGLAIHVTGEVLVPQWAPKPKRRNAQ